MSAVPLLRAHLVRGAMRARRVNVLETLFVRLRADWWIYIIYFKWIVFVYFYSYLMNIFDIFIVAWTKLRRCCTAALLRQLPLLSTMQVCFFFSLIISFFFWKKMNLNLFFLKKKHFVYFFFKKKNSFAWISCSWLATSLSAPSSRSDWRNCTRSQQSRNWSLRGTICLFLFEKKTHKYKLQQQQQTNSS